MAITPITQRAPTCSAGRTSARLPPMPTSERSLCAATTPSVSIFSGGWMRSLTTRRQGERMEEYLVRPIGFIRSELKKVDDAPMFYTEAGSPNARLELNLAFRDGLDRMQVGDDIIVITW